MDTYQEKYLKYKKKYLDLKDQLAGRNLNQVFNWTTKPLIDYDSKVIEGDVFGEHQFCDKVHLSYRVEYLTELKFFWCDKTIALFGRVTQDGDGVGRYAGVGGPAEKYIRALKYLVDKIGTPEFVFKGSGSQKYLVSSKITGLNDKSNIEKSSGFKLEWEIEGTPAQYNMPEKLKPRPFNKDKDLISGFGFQIKEGCMEKKIVDIIKFKENMDSFSAGFIKLFEEALPASKEFIKLTCEPPCRTAYTNKKAKEEDMLKATKEFVKKFENIWNFCHEFANKIRKPKDC